MTRKLILMKSDSVALYELAVSNPELFEDVNEAIDMLYILRCRGIAREKFLTFESVNKLCVDIIAGSNVDRHRLDQTFYQLPNRSATERFVNYVLKNKLDNIEEIYAEIKALEDSSILHYINSLR